MKGIFEELEAWYDNNDCILVTFYFHDRMCWVVHENRWCDHIVCTCIFIGVFILVMWPFSQHGSGQTQKIMSRVGQRFAHL